MFKFLKKTTKKLAWSAFTVWKDRKIQKTKEATAHILDKSVDKTVRSVNLGVVGIIILCGCAAGAFTLLPLGYCLRSMAAGLDASENTSLVGVLNNGACALNLVGGIMAGIIALAIVSTIIVCLSKKKKAKAWIDKTFRG